MRINVNNVQYHVEVEGEGEPVLLLHGFTGSREDWRSFVHVWKKEFKLITIDLPGHGKTDSPEDVKKYATKETVEALEKILDELKIESAFVLGYSLGGRVALSFAMTFPERVKRLILESSSPGLQTIQERLERKQKDDQLAEWILQEGVETFVNYWETIPLFHSQLRYMSNEERTRLRKRRLTNTEVGLANSLRGIGTGVQPSWWNQLDSLVIPTTLLVGALDSKFVRIAKEMLQLLPDGELIIIEDAGHAIHLEQPEEFSKKVQMILHNRKDEGNGNI
ncbi:2-succinyl-6-hydroxy-2,4-cyclohexadiene-1-carboxylate synthase [Pseudalkalibacillus sp. SCS-8]|uniref:2-succinyl-6-hydroxy-2, 4-cyclohexadiene-1-carboxylate synthase n=1 Tax=Pseudalkalibacillus nanhaiensis TaxID=3115291 RepID=UPI0032DBA528